MPFNEEKLKSEYFEIVFYKVKMYKLSELDELLCFNSTSLIYDEMDDSWSLLIIPMKMGEDIIYYSPIRDYPPIEIIKWKSQNSNSSDLIYNRNFINSNEKNIYKKNSIKACLLFLQNISVMNMSNLKINNYENKFWLSQV